MPHYPSQLTRLSGSDGMKCCYGGMGERVTGAVKLNMHVHLQSSDYGDGSEALTVRADLHSRGGPYALWAPHCLPLVLALYLGTQQFRSCICT